MTSAAPARSQVSPEDFAEILRATREFVRSRVMPRENEIMATDALPADLRAAAAGLGLFGFAIPQEWGGLGLDLVQDVELAMELGYTSLALRSMFGTNNGIAGQVLVNFGTDEQKAAWLERLASGEVVASFALTEPGAGSNPAGLRTRAVRDGDDWVISGAKRFITNAPVAGLFVVFARTREAAGADPGIAVFLVPAGTPGLEIGPHDRKMGHEGAWTADVTLTGVRVPAAALIGGSEEVGYQAAMSSLARGRVHIAAVAVGAARDMQTGVLAGESLVRECARKYQSGEDRPIAPLGGQALLHRDGRAGRRQCGAGPRRRRLHTRGARRTDLPRRAAAPPLRGHQRDPAAHHRRRPGAKREAPAQPPVKLGHA